ncbi:MAG: CBS domain-containing protein [Methanomassiliicoccales archaeon]
MERRIAELKVSEVMSKDLICVAPEMRLSELRQLFQDKDYNAFPVTVDGKLVGIVSKLDLMRIFAPGRGVTRADLLNTLLSEKVDDIMTGAVVSVGPDDDIELAVQYMVEYRLRSLPVVAKQQVVGMVSRGDLMKHLTIG